MFRRLRADFRAVVLAAGAQKPRRLGFRGEEGALSSFEFLRAVRAGSFTESLAGRQVLILGAGNVAMDAAGECFRLGAAGVTAVDVRKPAAHGEEVERALRLGTRILYPRFLESWEGGAGPLPRRLHAAGRPADRGGRRGARAGLRRRRAGRRPGRLHHHPALRLRRGGRGAPGADHSRHRDGRGPRRAASTGILRGEPPEPAEEAPAVEAERINLLYFQERDGQDSALEDCFSCGTCLQCDLCVEGCPRGAITRSGGSFTVNEEVCSGCGVCASVCPRAAIAMVPRRGR